MLGAFVAAQAPLQRQFDELGKRHLPADSDPTRALASGDVDGDGDPDVVLGNGHHSSFGTQNRLYLNDGDGTFRDATAARMPGDNDWTNAVALGDVDGDGDPDLILGNGAGQNRLYLNDGTGTFHDASAARMPADGDWTVALALGDVDGDGDLDVVLGNGHHTSSFGTQNRLYLNDGSGTFRHASFTWMPADRDWTNDVALGDVDGDGDPDMILGNHGQQNRLYLNDGLGRFRDDTAARMQANRDETISLALGDVDGDGDPDLMLGNYGQQNRLYLNDGSGAFRDFTATPMPADSDETRAVASGDVDGDGDPDVVLGNEWQQNRLYLNDGTGTFGDATAAKMPADSDYTRALALADVDGDGYPDVVLGNGRQQQNRLYWNDGSGRFRDATAARMPADSDETHAVALGDVDGDGDPDVLLGNVGQQNRLYLNDGSGRFRDATAARMPAASDQTRALALGDVDGDADLDLVAGNSGLVTLGQQNRLYLNDGSGTFRDATAARMPVDNEGTNAVALGDVDGDGDPDLVLGNGGQNRLYLNDGSGRFRDATAARMPVDDDGANAVALGDVDGDGYPDVVLGNWREQQNRLYLNDGTGSFRDATAARMPTDSAHTGALALGDVDGDGDRDILLGNSRQNRLYLNLLRQLDSPFLASPGRDYRLDTYARHGPPRVVDVAIPFVSTATARIPLPPFGTLGVDPRSMIPLPSFVVPQPAGVGSVTLAVPNNPSLVGLTIHAQVLLLQRPGPAFLTNMTSDQIVQ